MNQKVFNKAAIISFVILAFFLFSEDASAQCAMCKAITESNTLQNERVIGTGLNPAILYLMSMPYIILSLLGYFFFQKQINARILKLKVKYFEK